MLPQLENWLPEPAASVVPTGRGVEPPDQPGHPSQPRTATNLGATPELCTSGHQERESWSTHTSTGSSIPATSCQHSSHPAQTATLQTRRYRPRYPSACGRLSGKPPGSQLASSMQVPGHQPQPQEGTPTAKRRAGRPCDS